MIQNFHPLITEYLEYGRTIKAYSMDTLAGYRSALNAFAAAFPDKDLLEFNTPDLIAYDAGRARSLRPRSRARDICALRGFYRWLFEEKKAIGHDAAEKLKPPTLDDSSRSCPMGDVRQRLIDATGRLRDEFRCIRARAVLGVMFHAGLRPGDVCALQLPDVILRERESYLIVQKGKRNKRREVPLSDDLVAWLRDWLRIRHAPNQQFFVHGPSHRPVTKYLLRMILAEVKAAAGIRDDLMTPHSLRHSFATTLYDETKDLAMVQEILGHTSISSTRLYVHIDDKKKFAAIQRLNKRANPVEVKKPIKPIRLLKRQK